MPEVKDEKVIRCSRCGGRDVRPSHPHGLFDVIMKTFQQVPFRCRSCQHRFHRRQPLPAEELPEERAQATHNSPKA